MSEKIRFTAVMRFEITPEAAAQVLSDPKPDIAAHGWIANQNPAPEPYIDSHLANQIKTALGAFLAEKRIAEAKQLTLPADPIKEAASV